MPTHSLHGLLHDQMGDGADQLFMIYFAIFFNKLYVQCLLKINNHLHLIDGLTNIEISTHESQSLEFLRHPTDNLQPESILAAQFEHPSDIFVDGVE